MTGPSPAVMREALRRAATALDAAGIDYALMGGLASALVGRDRATRDIDLFLAEKDAGPALDVLAGAGFSTERTDEAWLFKAWWKDAMVDLIFCSKGGVRLDREMLQRRRRLDVDGVRLPALAPEDLVLIKALASAEHVPRHWYDALAILAAGGIDWDYLVRRSRPHPHRVLSLLAYAVSDGTEVPTEVMRTLFEMGQEHAADAPDGDADRVAADQLAARIREVLATDPVLAEPHLAVDVTDTRVLLRGKVATPSRRAAVERMARSMAGDHAVDSRIEVVG